MASPPFSWPLLLLLYLLFSLLITLSTLHHTLHVPRSPILPPVLSLLSTLSLVPSLPSLRPSPPRLSILAIFLVSLSTLLSSLLRLLSSLSTLHHPTAIPPPSPLLQLLLPLSLLPFLRSSPSLRVLRPAAPSPLHLLLPPLPPSRGQRRIPAAPALLSVLLHVSVAALTAAADASALFLSPASAAVAALAAALLSASLALPLLRLSLRVLVHGSPARVAAAVRRTVETLSAVDGVVRCDNVRVWEESLGVFVATVAVVVAKDADSRFVLNQAVKLFDGVVNDLTVQVETVRDDVAQGAVV